MLAGARREWPIDSFGMRLRTILKHVCAAASLLAAPLQAQDGPAKRLASIVGVAVEEYGKAVDATGRLVSDLEYDEAVTFLADAKEVADRLGGSRAPAVRAVLDSLAAAVAARRPPAELFAMHERFGTALGDEGAMDLPTRPIDLAAGKRIYEQSCASCHGATGQGDGPASAGMNPPPPALGTREAMHDVTPALMYRIVSVGIAGTPMPSFSALSADDRWDVVSYVNTLRAPVERVAEGEGSFAQRCASCHGLAGQGGGALAASLSTMPPEVASFAWQAERSDLQIGELVRSGIPGTAMPAARDLTDADIAGVVAYVRTLGHQAAGAEQADDASGEAAGRRAVALLDEALTLARSSRNNEANDRAFDAYIAFEPLETVARAKSPGLVASLERHFADFRGALKASDYRRAEQSRNAIEAGMPDVVALTRPTGSGWGAFLQSFLIILREGLEAILVIGAVVTFLIKTGNRDRLRAIWVGCALALAASAVTAVVLATVLRAMPATREVIEGVTMLIAVGVLFSVSYWLISKVEAAKWQQFIREKVTAALEHGGGRALTVVAFLAVYREGAETALFYQALFQEGAQVGVPISLGIVAGAAVLAVVFTLVYRFGVRIPLRPFFAVTSALLYFMAFVFMGKGIRELQEGNVVSITVLPGFPHVDAIGLFPSVETLLAQLVLVALLVFALVKTFWPRRSVALPTIETAPPVRAGTEAEAAARVEALAAEVRRLQARLEEIEGALPVAFDDGAVAAKTATP